MCPLEEGALIRRAQAGDRQAYVALIDAHEKAIQRLLLGLTKNSHAAEDLTQDVWLKVWANLKSFKPGTHFRAWLARIARNTFLNSLRQHRVSYGHEEFMAGLTTREPGPVAVLEARETEALVETAEAQLPATCRAAFRLRTRQGMPFRKVGQALALPAATARWQVYHARHLLRKKLRSLREQACN
jgi:RNA polymerase sigma-70 factor (ECF subfamily)